MKKWIRLPSRACAFAASCAVLAAARAQTPASPAHAGHAAQPAVPPAAATGTGLNAAGEIFVDVGRAGTRKLRMAIPAFGSSVEKGTPSEAERGEFAQRLSDILNFTGAFEFIPESGFLQKKDPASKPLNFDEWSPINTEALIFGKVEPGTAGKFNLEMRLYDVKRKKMLEGKRYSNLEKRDVDSRLRRFADLVMKALTGELGIFSTKIAFVGAKRAGDPKQLFIANFDGTDLQQLTDNRSINMSPAWSPDGTKLTFTSFKDGGAEIYVYNMITRKTLRMTRSNSGNNSGANWAPDGKSIAFASSDMSSLKAAGGAAAFAGATAIFTMSSGGGPRQMLISSPGGRRIDVEPAFSPDGSKIAWASDRFGNPHIFVRDLSTKTDTRITFAGWYNSTPSWRADAKKLAFAGYDKEIDRYDLFIVNPDGRQLERLTLDQGDNERPTWSPDGNFIAFQSNRAIKGSGKQKPYRIFVMNRDGGDQRPINIPLAEVNLPAWSPRLDVE